MSSKIRGILRFDLQFVHYITVETLHPIAITAGALSVLFSLCYLGTKIAFRVNYVADIAYNMKWYNYPVKLQPFVLLIMIRAEKSFYLSGYGLMPCTLNNFLQVNQNHNFIVLVTALVL